MTKMPCHITDEKTAERRLDEWDAAWERYETRCDELRHEYRFMDITDAYHHLFEDEVIELLGSIEGVAKGEDCLEEIDRIQKLIRKAIDSGRERLIMREAADE